MEVTNAPEHGQPDVQTVQPLFEMHHVTKRFPGVVALNDVSFDCYPGEVHALVGENGAGKSTLMKVLSGVYQPDEGSIWVDGARCSFRHPLDAQRAGISIIYQEFNLLPDRTVAQNIFIGREPTKRGLINYEEMRRNTQRLLSELEVDDWISPDMLVRHLSVAGQQMVEIAKALSFESRVLIMDEPTAALAPHEVEVLFRLVRRLQQRGLGIVYISHRFKEIFELADRITVLKDGKKVATVEKAAVTSADIIEMMVGRPLEEFYPDYAKPDEIGEVVLRVVNGGNQRLRNINLELRSGEIVGLAGLQGSGTTDLVRAIFGSEPFQTGTIELAGKPVRMRRPRQAVRRRMAFLSENRKEEGLFLMQSVRDNIAITVRALRSLLGPIRRNRLEQDVTIEGLAQEVDVRAAGLHQEVQYLSGGNQQKVLLARWLATRAKVWIFAEPTRGIDVNAKAAIHARIRELARSGSAVLMTSSELPEVIGMSDRIVVMHEGTIAGELPAGASEAQIMRLATGEAADTGQVSVSV